MFYRGNEMEIAELKELLENYDRKRECYDDAKTISSNMYKIYKDVEAKVLQAFEDNEIDNFASDDYKFSRVTKLSYKTPKTTEDKKELFAFLDERFGEASINYLGVNSQTLNKLAKELHLSGVDNIPGLEEPVSVDSLSRRSK